MNKKFKEAEDLRYIYQNELNKACFQHAMVYVTFKDLHERTASGNVLCDKTFNITKKLKYDKYQGLASMVYIFFNKNSSACVQINLQVMLYCQRPTLRKINLLLAEALHKQIENLKSKKCSHFLKKIFGVRILHICN